jgi:hypothetical protein
MARSVFPYAMTIDYPSADGLPLAESDFQRHPLIYAVEALRAHFQLRYTQGRIGCQEAGEYT